MKVSENFLIQEFVYPEIYQQFGDKSIWFIDQRIINIVQYLRTKLGKSIIVNNWHTGGNYKESGLRAFDTPTGGKLSQHKFGRAADIKVCEMYPFEVSEFIKTHYSEFTTLGLTAIEHTAYTSSWLHLDCRYTGKNELLIVKP